MNGNMVRNGSFEKWKAGLPVGWTVTGMVTQDTMSPHQGMSDAHLSASTIPASVSQTVQLPFLSCFLGPHLRFGFSLKGPVQSAMGQSFHMVAAWQDPSGNVVGGITTLDVMYNGTDYTYYSGFTTPMPLLAMAMKLDFTALSSPSLPLNVQLDDVAVW